uniref:Uncharacterized protein n=1 Tax=Caenorhabditis japonica TaxID=281687 RepID=A0A8R1DTB7_CAEJA
MNSDPVLLEIVDKTGTKYVQEGHSDACIDPICQSDRKYQMCCVERYYCTWYVRWINANLESILIFFVVSAYIVACLALLIVGTIRWVKKIDEEDDEEEEEGEELEYSFDPECEV